MRALPSARHSPAQRLVRLLAVRAHLVGSPCEEAMTGDEIEVSLTAILIAIEELGKAVDRVGIRASPPSTPRAR